MSPAPIKSVAILGGGTAGWMTAAWFAKLLRAVVPDVVVVESESIGTVGVGEATVPSFRKFNAILGIDEDELIRQTQATFKLGIEFVDWGVRGDRYAHPFGPNGRSLNGIPFHSVWLKGWDEGIPSDLGDYNLQALAARRGKFMRPVGENSPLSTVTYAFQFDAALYARYLRQFSEQRGIRRIEGRMVAVDLHPESGFIQSLRLEDGQTIAADLFIDCSGFAGLLIAQALGVRWVDWSHWLPCDRAFAMPTVRTRPPDPFTRATALPAGWQWHIPLQHRTGNGHVFASPFITETAALDLLMSGVDGAPLAEPRLLKFQAGRRQSFWVKNCVAIGLSAGFLEPLESTSIYLIQGAIGRLHAFFPDCGFAQEDIAAYNQESIREYEDVRDFIILHYKLTRRDDSEFWKYCRTMPIPDGITEKMQLFSSRGRIVGESGEQFGLSSWLAVMVGQGLRPCGNHPLLQAMPDRDLRTWLADVKSLISNCCDHMPTHERFIQENGLTAMPSQ